MRFITVFFTLFAIFFTTAVGAKKKAPIIDQDLAMREYMVEITRQIGVTCTHCHNLKNFKDSSKDLWKVGAQHIEVVKGLNRHYLKQLGIEKVDCYMCHRGKPKPNYKEKLALTED